MNLPPLRLPPLRAKLIFNAIAGTADLAPQQLLAVIRELQAWGIRPEVYLIEPGRPVAEAIDAALAQGLRFFVVCGGDGTIDAVAAALAGRPLAHTTLGIVPLGTQNNVALSLGIPTEIPAAVALLRTGRRRRVDIGHITYDGTTLPFLEACSAGLISALFPAADDIQHGNLARIGDFLATLVTSPAADIRLILDGHTEVRAPSHAVLIANMPYVGPHYQVDPAAACDDGLLDVLLFAELSKLELVGYALQEVVGGGAQDERVRHYRVRSVAIHTEPPMPIIADGNSLGSGPLGIAVAPRTLAIMGGPVAQGASAPAAQLAATTLSGKLEPESMASEAAASETPATPTPAPGDPHFGA
jgi:diacylglycerol kinase (ATP)